MTILLKQSTAKTISFGPFVDKTDGVTPETGLVSALDHASTGIMLSKNGGALTIRNATVTASTYDAYGNYIVTLDTTDTNTLGTMRMQFIETATCLPVFQDFMVLPATVYDALVTNATTAAGGLGDIQRVAGTAQTAGDLAALVATAITYIDTEVAAILAAVDTEVAAIKAKTDNLPTSPAAVGSAMTLAADSIAAATITADAGAEIAAAILDLSNGVETGLTFRQALRLFSAVLGGKLSGAGTGTEVFRNAVADAKARVTATCDGVGNRTAITTDLT